MGQKKFSRRYFTRPKYRIGNLSHEDSVRMTGILFTRDHGVCRLCGLDTRALAEALWYVLDLCERTDEKRLNIDFCAFLLAIGRNVKNWPARLWEIDHIIPRSYGGGDAQENLRTLCGVCHDEETYRVIHRGEIARRGQIPPDHPVATKFSESYEEWVSPQELADLMAKVRALRKEIPGIAHFHLPHEEESV